MNKGLLTSKTDEQETPQWLFDKLNAQFNFKFDVCANQNNATCKTYFDKETDGLSQEWTGACWMNPPYGRKIGAWMKKAMEAEATVVCLVPSRTDTKWWHEYAMKASEIRFIKGRLKFGDSKNSAPFPSAIIVFGKTHEDLKVCSMERG